MSKYTTELRFICETLAGNAEETGYNKINTVIETARPKLFDFDFPIFDEAYRATLETKIIKHFYTREICEETVGLWKLRLDSKLNEIMPYFNKLYESELITYNPLYMTDLQTERTIKHDGTFNSDSDTATSNHRTATDSRNGSGSRESSSNNITDDWQVYSETPQGSLTGVDEETYLTNATHSYGNTEGSEASEEYDNSESGTTLEDGTGTSNSTVSSKDNSLETYLDHVFGYAGSNPSENIIKFRNAILNIDVQIIEQLNPLFFNLW